MKKNTLMYNAFRLTLVTILIFLFGCKKNVTPTTNSFISNVTICNQVWMSKNLDVGNYRNGDLIPQVTDPIAWANLTTGAWCWYNNDSATFSALYGRLYNWYAINDPRGLAPPGWHIPSESEWNKLVICLDPIADTLCIGCEESTIAGGALKDTGTANWFSPNLGATNSSGFTALPAGQRNNNGTIHTFDNIRYAGGWWSSTEHTTTTARTRYVHSFTAGSYITVVNKVYGLSVRCVKD